MSGLSNFSRYYDIDINYANNKYFYEFLRVTSDQEKDNVVSVTLENA